MIDEFKSSELVCAYHYSKNISRFVTRLPTAIFSYKLSGITEYHQGTRTVTTTPGKMTYIPLGATFSTTIVDPGAYLEIKFVSSKPPRDTSVKIFSDFDQRKMETAFRETISSFFVKDDSTYFKCQSSLNTIFAMLACSYGSKTPVSYEERILAPAIEYMKENLFHQDFSISDMLKKVNISDTYFRTLFKRQYQMTPKQYINAERVSLAKYLLTTSWISVMDVANSVGFADEFYFSRFFKKETGESPQSFARRVKTEALDGSV